MIRDWLAVTVLAPATGITVGLTGIDPNTSRALAAALGVAALIANFCPERSLR